MIHISLHQLYEIVHTIHNCVISYILILCFFHVPPPCDVTALGSKGNASLMHRKALFE